ARRRSSPCSWDFLALKTLLRIRRRNSRPGLRSDSGHSKHADRERGLVFVDPLDDTEVRWNPIRRATKKLSAGKHYIEARLPGSVVGKPGHKQFVPLPWQVHIRELAKRIAPCVIHTLDVFFNALVVEGLHAAGVEQLVAIHDSWFLSELDGAELLMD